MKFLKENIALIVLYLLTAFTLLISAFTDIVLMTPHYIGFTILLIAIIVSFFKSPLSQILVAVILLFSIFIPASFLPSVTTFGIGKLRLRGGLYIDFFTSYYRKSKTSIDMGEVYWWIITA